MYPCLKTRQQITIVASHESDLNKTFNQRIPQDQPKTLDEPVEKKKKVEMNEEKYPPACQEEFIVLNISDTSSDSPPGSPSGSTASTLLNSPPGSPVGSFASTLLDSPPGSPSESIECILLDSPSGSSSRNNSESRSTSSSSGSGSGSGSGSRSGSRSDSRSGSRSGSPSSVHSGMDIFILDSYAVILLSDNWTSWGEILGTKITPLDWIFWTTFFLI